MTLRETVLSAIDNPGDWEMIGLLQDVAEELRDHSQVEAALLEAEDRIASLKAAIKDAIRDLEYA